MKLIDAKPDLPKGLLMRQVSEGGLVEFGLYKVAFGWRVRAGFTCRMTCELDWCAGDKWVGVSWLYSLLSHVLSEREERCDCFRNLPVYNDPKPFFNDRMFLERMLEPAIAMELRMLDEERAKSELSTLARRHGFEELMKAFQ